MAVATTHYSVFEMTVLDGVSVPAEDSAELYLVHLVSSEELKKLSLQINLRKNYNWIFFCPG